MARVAFTFVLALLLGCQSTDPVGFDLGAGSGAGSLQSCPLMGHFDSDADVEAALPTLYRRAQRDLVIIGFSVYACACTRTGLGGTAAAADLGGAAQATDLGGASKGTELGGAAKATDLGGAAKGTDLGGAAKGPDVAGAAKGPEVDGATKGSEVDGAAKGTEVDGAAKGSELAGAVKGSELGGAVKGTELGGASKGSTLAGGAKGLTCRVIRTALGYALQSPARRIRIYDGAQLWEYRDGALVAAR